MKDLWGNELPKERKGPVARGYAAQPGTGPKGQTCKTCRFYTHTLDTAKKYIKCELMREFWTGGPGTDIKASSPACEKFEHADPKPGPGQVRPADACLICAGPAHCKGKSRRTGHPTCRCPSCAYKDATELRDRFRL